MDNAPLGMILSAGFGTRLLPLTQFRQKTIIEFGVYPVIYYLLKMFEKSGIKEVVINLHHLPDQVPEQVRSFNLGLKIHFLREEKILGTAGAIKNAVEKLNRSLRKMVIMHGDIVCDLDLSKHLQNDEFCSLICATDQTIDGYVGSVSVNEDGIITELGRYFTSEAPKVRSGFFTGIHILSPKAVGLINESPQSCLVSEVYPEWLRAGLPIQGSMQDVYFADLGSPERLWAGTMRLFDEEKRFRFLDPFAGLDRKFGTEKNSYFGKNVQISPQAKIIHPVIIADDTRIESGSIIGPRAMIGRRVFVDARACVKSSIVMSDTSIKKDENLDCAIALSCARVEVKPK